MKKVLFGALVAAAIVASDYARAAPPVPLYNWTGFYTGLNAGGAWGTSVADSVLICEGPINCYGGSAASGINGQPAQTFNPRAFTGGVQAGYNYQFENSVAGLEADFNSLRLSGSSSASQYFAAFPGPGAAPTYTNSVSTSWLFTARGKVGYAAGNWLIYGTGGLAVTSLSYKHTFVEGTFVGSANGTETTNVSPVKAGYALGAGLEYGVTKNWTIRGEYLYVNFGNINPSASVFTPGGVSEDVFHHTADLKVNIARLGVNYRF